MSLISTSNLTLAYDGVEVVKNLNIQIDSGDYVCIIGENGSGKSTLAKAILGLIRPVSGKIEFADNESRSNIGYLPQQTNVQKDFPASVQEIVMSGFIGKLSVFPFYKKSQKNKADEILKTLGIYHIKKQCYNKLSGGMQQRVLLARALCAAQNILILDEPVASLDPIITSEFYDIIDKLNKQNNITVIMISHDTAAVEKYATKVIHLSDSSYIFDTAQNYMASEYGKKYIGGESNANN